MKGDSQVNDDQWKLAGNAGTNPTNNFLGTTDEQPLIIKTNDMEAIHVSTDGKVGIGNSNPEFKLEVMAQDQLGLAVQGPNSGVGARANASKFAGSGSLENDD